MEFWVSVLSAGSALLAIVYYFMRMKEQDEREEARHRFGPLPMPPDDSAPDLRLPGAVQRDD